MIERILGLYLTALSSALSPSNTKVYTLTHMHSHTPLDIRTHGPHILWMVNACSLLFGSQWLMLLYEWTADLCVFVCVYLHSVCQLCYDVICFSETMLEKRISFCESLQISHPPSHVTANLLSSHIHLSFLCTDNISFLFTTSVCWVYTMFHQNGKGQE